MELVGPWTEFAQAFQSRIARLRQPWSTLRRKRRKQPVPSIAVRSSTHDMHLDDELGLPPWTGQLSEGQNTGGQMRRLVGLTALAIIATMARLPAAASATSFTVRRAQTFSRTVAPPCTGESGPVKATGNEVAQFSFHKAGDGWFTFTMAATFTFVAANPGTVN